MLSPVSIRINILSNFLFLLGLIAAVLLGLQYYFSQQLAMSAAHKSFTQSAASLTRHIQSRNELINTILEMAELYPDLDLSPEDPRNLETIKRFTHIMRDSSSVYAMYIGHKNSEFLEVINMKLSDDLYKHFNAPANTRWLIEKVYGNTDDTAKERLKHLEFYDKDLILLASRTETSTYQANKRPWFIRASQSKKSIKTDPYLFSNLQQKGITFAKVIKNSDSVLAVDFTLSKMNELLKQEKTDINSELVLFNRDGQVVASSEGEQSNSQLNTIFAQLLKAGKTDQLIHYKSDSINKFLMVSTIASQQERNNHIGISIDTSTMLNPYLEKIIYSLFIALLFLLLSIPLVIFTTTRIIKPIKALMVQNTKIKERQFADVQPIESNIIELLDLSSSLVSMSQSIQAYQKAQQDLMDSFIHLIAEAIDSKSAYTGGHCQRVPKIAVMLAEVVHDSKAENFSTFQLQDEDAWREFKMGALLHDCGKVTTPEYVVDKSAKLETIYNRIHEIRTRFEVIWRDIDIEYYQRAAQGEDIEQLNHWKKSAQQSLQNDFVFISEVNIGGEFLGDDKRQRIRKIGQRTWQRHFNDRVGLADVELLRYKNSPEVSLPVTEQLLSDKPEHIIERINFDAQAYREQGFKLHVPEYLYNYGEVYNLCIEKGTLTDEERFKINEHVIMTIKMLELLPFPEHMKKIPEYAGTHHETLIGTGYPRQLTKKELSIAARIMAIADIFEALTASDRPYKKGKTLSEAIRIMGRMKTEQHIDGEIFDLFLQSGVYLEYAHKYLKAQQIDTVNINAYLG